MELKKGYKQTEVGVIPEEWEAGSLSRFWSVTDCKHVTAEFVPNGFPIASIKEVQSRFVYLTEAKQTTQHFYNLLIEGGRKPQTGDLIISRNATVGEIAQVADWHPLFSMGQDVCLLRKKSSDYSTEFLQAVFQSPVIANQLSNLMVGSTFKRVNVEQIRNFAVPMPRSSEQLAIAAALRDVDGLIGGLEQLIAKKRDLKQAAMQQLLTGKKRLAGFRGEWGKKCLSDVADIVMGQSPDSKYYNRNGDGLPLIQGNADIENRRSIARVWTTQLTRQGRAGDLLLTVRAPVGAVGRISEHCCLGRGVCSLKPNANTDFLFNALIFAERDWKILEQGSTFTSANSTQVAAFSISVPVSIPEQTAIAEVLSDMDAELAALEQRRDKTRDLKQSMMQALLTGKTRLV